METTMSRGLEQFDPTVERIDDYKERFDYYCVANGVGNDRKKALFLTKIGQKMFSNLKDSRIQRELLCIRDLSLAQAQDKARSMEIVLKETVELRQKEPDVSVEAGNDEGTSETHKISKSQGPRKGCPRCGGTNHMAANCFHKDKECNHCGKVGHLARVCRSGAGGKSKPMWKKSKDAMRAHMVQAEEREDSGSFEDEEKETDDEIVELKFEVDTGAELSLIPLKVYKERLSMVKVLPSSVVLKLYDGSILPTRGKVVVEAMQGRHRATGEFVIVENADFQLPLLGRDWLGKLRLDWQGLLKSCTKGDPRINALHTASWINEFPDVVKEGLGQLKGIRADIELKGKVKPIFCKSRAVPFALRKQVEEILQQQVEDGELQPVEQSEWAAPIVVVKKKDGGIRICADFKMTINPYLRHKTFPLPTPEEIFATLANGESFTKLDLARAYKQMEVASDSQLLLTITTHMGLFKFSRLPFGVATAPAMWQRAMSIVFQGCKRVVYYMDDILVTGNTREEHESNLRQVFQRLQQYGLRINLSKCHFFQHTVEFLGHSISTDGIRPTDERIRGVVGAPVPTNKGELKSFLGLMTYNAKFLPQLATVLHPLYQLLCKDVKWKWSKVHDIAVKEAKHLLLVWGHVLCTSSEDVSNL
ncbi:hypothetical protein EMCRGX_G015084 [Ephydatia muelleri]